MSNLKKSNKSNLKKVNFEEVVSEAEVEHIIVEVEEEFKEKKSKKRNQQLM